MIAIGRRGARIRENGLVEGRREACVTRAAVGNKIMIIIKSFRKFGGNKAKDESWRNWY